MSDLVERAAVLEMLANHSADALDRHLVGIRSLRGDLGWAIRALPTAEPERLGEERRDVDKLTRENERLLDMLEAWGHVLYMAEGGDSYSWEHGGPEWRAKYAEKAAAVAQAFARAMLTSEAFRAYLLGYMTHAAGPHAGDRAHTAGMRAALEHAGLHVAAEPVADESDAEVMLAAVREKMAPEHVAAFDAARAAVYADAERTRGVLMGALDKAKRLRVDPAKAATLPRTSIGLPAPAAPSDADPCPVDELEIKRWAEREDRDGYSVHDEDADVAWLIRKVQR